MILKTYHKQILLLLAWLLFSVLVPAQSTTQQINHKLSEKTVVKDSLGNKYDFQHWQELVMSGEFTIVPQFPEQENTEFLLKKMSAVAKEKRFATMPKPKESESFRTGAKLYPFSEKTINGERLRLKDLAGKVVVLNFWFINCPPCRVEIPQLNQLVDSYRADSTVVFIAVGLDSKSQIADFLKTLPFEYKIIDAGKNLADRYGIRTYPTHIVVDRVGVVRFHTSGLALNTVHWLKKTIDAIILDASPQKKIK